jgi:hypothetical protein
MKHVRRERGSGRGVGVHMVVGVRCGECARAGAAFGRKSSLGTSETKGTVELSQKIRKKY